MLYSCTTVQWESQKCNGLLVSVSKQLLNASYRPYVPHSLAIILKRYINTKSKNERETTKFLEDLRTKLYFIHEYNQEVAKLQHEYPKSRQFDLLLVLYIELEFEMLYNNNNYNRALERQVAQRVMRLLQIVVSNALPTHEVSMGRSRDVELNNLLLKLLVCVKPEYLSKNKFIYNIARNLFRKIKGNNDVFCLETVWKQFGNKNLTTSDYGTDDSDNDDNDVEQVPLTDNGISPMVTIELVGDSGYMTYLQKRLDADNQLSQSGSRQNSSVIEKKCDCPSTSSTKTVELETNIVELSDTDDETIATPPPAKRKKIDKQAKKKIPKDTGVVTFEILDDDEEGNNYMVYMQEEVKTAERKPVEKSVEIIICSDSEDETENTDVKDSKLGTTSFVKEEGCDQDVQIKVKSEELVSNSTVSVCDDTNVNSTSNFLVDHDQGGGPVDVKLEFELIPKTSESPRIDDESIKIEKEQFLLIGENSGKVLNDEDIKSEIQQLVESSAENRDSVINDDDETLDDFLEFFNTIQLPVTESKGSVVFNTSSPVRNTSNNLNTQSNITSEIEVKNKEISVISSENLEVPAFAGINFSVLDDIKKPNTSAVPENLCLFEFPNESELKIGEDLNSTDLIDPSLIFQEIALNSTLFESTALDGPSVKSNSFDETVPKSNAELSVIADTKFSQKSSLGGPLLNQKSVSSDLSVSSEECRISDSVLEKLMLDNSFFLDEGKEFDLECFLFDEVKEGFEESNQFSEILLKAKDECLDHLIEGAQHVQLTWETAFDVDSEQESGDNSKMNGKKKRDDIKREKEKAFEKIEPYSRRDSRDVYSLDRRKNKSFSMKERHLQAARWQQILKNDPLNYLSSSCLSNQS